MKASDVINTLTALVNTHGDREVYLDVSAHGLLEIGEIDVDADDTGIIFWPKDEEE